MNAPVASPAPLRLDIRPLHLGPGGVATIEPEFTGEAWYEGYGQRHASDGADGQLISMHSFSESWDSWEMHPLGDEIVVCIVGRMTVVQEMADGSHVETPIGAGDYAINPPGCWHTADIATGESATAVFITTGLGTQARPR